MAEGGGSDRKSRPSRIPWVSRLQRGPEVIAGEECLVFAEPENFLKLQLLCWPLRTFSSSSCPLPGQRSCWAGKGAGAEQGCGAGVHFLPPLSQLCCGYLTIIRKFEILSIGFMVILYGINFMVARIFF